MPREIGLIVAMLDEEVYRGQTNFGNAESRDKNLAAVEAANSRSPKAWFAFLSGQAVVWAPRAFGGGAQSSAQASQAGCAGVGRARATSG
jgi:hypothetical protein